MQGFLKFLKVGCINLRISCKTKEKAFHILKAVMAHGDDKLWNQRPLGPKVVEGLRGQQVIVFIGFSCKTLPTVATAPSRCPGTWWILREVSQALPGATESKLG